MPSAASAAALGNDCASAGNSSCTRRRGGRRRNSAARRARRVPGRGRQGRLSRCRRPVRWLPGAAAPLLEARRWETAAGARRCARRSAAALDLAGARMLVHQAPPKRDDDRGEHAHHDQCPARQLRLRRASGTCESPGTVERWRSCSDLRNASRMNDTSVVLDERRGVRAAPSSANIAICVRAPTMPSTVS